MADTTQKLNNMKTALIISLFIFLLPLSFLIKDYSFEFLAVDSCLDSGGSYDYDNNKCDKKADHPYMQYSTRKKALILSCTSLSLIGLASFLRIKKKSKQKHDKKKT